MRGAAACGGGLKWASGPPPCPRARLALAGGSWLPGEMPASHTRIWYPLRSGMALGSAGFFSPDGLWGKKRGQGGSRIRAGPRRLELGLCVPPPHSAGSTECSSSAEKVLQEPWPFCACLHKWSNLSPTSTPSCSKAIRPGMPPPGHRVSGGP